VVGVAVAVAIAATVAALACLAPASAQTPAPTPTPVPDLILDGGRVRLAGRQTFGRVVLTNRARLEIQPYSGGDDTGRLEIVANSIVIDRSSTVTGSEAGYRGRIRADGEGPGGGQGGLRTFDGGGGGAHGGRGGDGVLDNVGRPGALGGRPYGDDCSPEIDRGSAGGAPGTADNAADPGAGANGGAALVLVADTVIISGTIEVDAADGVVAANDAAGGGAGGGVLVRARHLEQSGRIAARGGDGGDVDDGGGGGGGGRIKLLYQTGSVNRRVLDVSGGRGDGNGYHNDGDDGSVCIKVSPPTETPTPEPSATPTDTPMPTDTPTSAPTFTPSPTPSPTDTPTATPTATPSPTPTPVPRPCFLPIALREPCPKVPDQPISLALVLDASTTMRGPTSTGRPKLEAALEAAAVAVNLMGPTDRLAVVTFNAAAHLVVPLTEDRQALLAGLATVRSAPGSLLDGGVDTATAELGRAHPGHTKRMVVLSDGLPNPTGPAESLAAAERARMEGILIDTVGLGTDVDATLLRAMASGPAHYFESPDAEDLARLFADLAWRPPPCGGRQMWPSVP
jgi:cell division septation protein DedD